MKLNSRLKISRGPCWTSIPSRIRPQGPHASWTLMPQMSQSERCSVRWSTESKSQLPTSPAFSMAHKEIIAPRGENFSHHHITPTLQTLPPGQQSHHSLKWLRTFKRPEGILARWIETLAEFDFEIEHRANSVWERSPPTTGLMNVREQTNSSSHCLFTRFSCAPSSQMMPLPSYKQKIPRLEKPMR